MAYLIAQALFAVVFYPLFLILLSTVARFLIESPKRWKKALALIVLTTSAVATCLSVAYFVDPAVDVSTYLIASTVWMIFMGHYLIKLTMPKRPQHGNLVYCMVLIFLPILDVIIALFGGFTPSSFLTEQTIEMSFFIDILRWPLNLVLAVWSSIYYKLYRRFILIGLGCVVYAAMLYSLYTI